MAKFEDDTELVVDKIAPLTHQEFDQLKRLTEKFKPVYGAAPDGSEPVHFVDANSAYESGELSWGTFQASSGEMYGFAMWSPNDRRAWVSKLKSGAFEFGIGGPDGDNKKNFPTLQAALQASMPLFDDLFSEIQAEFGED